MRMTLTVMTASIACSAIASSQAAAESPVVEQEPNNNIWQLNGPVGGAGIQGSITAEGDNDWYLVRLNSQRQVSMEFRNLSLQVDGTSNPKPTCRFILRSPDGQTNVWSQGFENYPAFVRPQAASTKT